MLVQFGMCTNASGTIFREGELSTLTGFRGGPTVFSA
jgi:hypothetical protein